MAVWIEWSLIGSLTDGTLKVELYDIKVHEAIDITKSISGFLNNVIRLIKFIAGQGSAD